MCPPISVEYLIFYLRIIDLKCGGFLRLFLCGEIRKNGTRNHRTFKYALMLWGLGKDVVQYRSIFCLI